MVSLNFTFFVLLAMFLVFLWAMHRFVFKPTLGVLDEREDHIVGAKETAARESKEAEQIEDSYARRIGQIHREANLRLVEAHRQAQDEHNEKVEAFKKVAEEDLRTQRKALRAEVAEQKKQIEPLAAELATIIATTLELK